MTRAASTAAETSDLIKFRPAAPVVPPTTTRARKGGAASSRTLRQGAHRGRSAAKTVRDRPERTQPARSPSPEPEEPSEERHDIAFPGEGIYSGQCVHHGSVPSREGHGKFWYVNGDVYEGSWRRSLPHGTGKIRYATGAVYDGGFSRGKRHGHGTLFYANGDVYDGAWSDDNKEGHGVFTWAASGERYEGAWQAGVMDGDGYYSFADGCGFRGSYLDGKRHGFGVFIQPSGMEEGGDWEHGALVRSRPADGSAQRSLGELISGAQQSVKQRRAAAADFPHERRASSKLRSQRGGRGTQREVGFASTSPSGSAAFAGAAFYATA